MKKKSFIVFAGVLVILLIILVLCMTVKKENANENTNKNQNIAKIWGENETVNPPILLKGMEAIIFEEGKDKPIILEEKDRKEGIWYDYAAQESDTKNGGTSRWANAMTEDGSMWVWIPRYAYKIEWDQEKEATGKIDIMFLDGTTNYNKEGKDIKSIGYTVHPAFTNGEKNNYSNGEWDKEITGIWISKFEAGYAGQKNTASENIPIIETDLCYQRESKNILGKIVAEETHITYPVFIGKTYSYNNIEIGEMYDLSKALNSNKNPYGFDNTADSHLLKNSEWGAVTYLTHSQYGRNGTKVSINNLDISNVVHGVTTVTGYAASDIAISTNAIEKVEGKLQDSYNDKSYAWYSEKGKLASTTGNMYGIYDMNGACSEYTAGYLEAINEDKGIQYAKNMLQNKTSTKYCTVYKAAKGGSSDSITKNYEANLNIYGSAIQETSKTGKGYTSWFGETSTFIRESDGFFLRSGGYDRVGYSGLFDFTNHSGHSYESYSFRCALIKE